MAPVHGFNGFLQSCLFTKAPVTASSPLCSYSSPTPRPQTYLCTLGCKLASTSIRDLHFYIFFSLLFLPSLCFDPPVKSVSDQAPRVATSAVTLARFFCRSSFDILSPELAPARSLRAAFAKKCTCDKLCYQETTHHYPWAWDSVSRNKSNRKSTVGERNGRASPVKSDHEGAGCWREF